jgi:hypothetical protein
MILRSGWCNGTIDVNSKTLFCTENVNLTGQLHISRWQKFAAFYHRMALLRWTSLELLAACGYYLIIPSISSHVVGVNHGGSYE